MRKILPFWEDFLVRSEELEVRSFGATPIINKVVEKRSLSSLSALADMEGDRVAVVGSSLAVILQLDRTTNHCKGRIYPSRE